MLVLSRYRDESIVIGDDIIVTVVDVRGDRVRLGIQAPMDVSVHRREIYDLIAKEKETQRSFDETPETKPPKKVQAPPTDPIDPTLGLNSFDTFPQ